jgi:Carboxypeptidase regulatory-like domain
MISASRGHFAISPRGVPSGLNSGAWILRVLGSAVAVALLGIALPSLALAQGGSGGSVSGTVTDPTGAVIRGATVTIYNPLSGFQRTVSTNGSGNFTIPNVPYSSYHTTVSAKGFATHVQDVDVRSSVPVTVAIKLELPSAHTVVTVTGEPHDLLSTSPAMETNISRQLFSKLPLESQSSSLSSLVTLASPGVAADSNGLFHGIGDHASNSFSLDGQPITDQQSKVFSNQIPVDAVQSMQVFEGGDLPAQYGDKTSLIIKVTTRSGQGDTTPHGDVSASYGTFGTTNDGFDLGYGGQKWGNFIAANGLDTSRFLDGPEFDVMHDKGNEENAFDRVDYSFSQKDSLMLNLEFTRSWFQTPNSYDAEDATAWTGLVVNNGGLGPNGLPVGPTDQKSQIRTFDVAPTWTHLINPNMVATFGLWFRHDEYQYFPSSDPFADLIPDLQDETIGQFRTLGNAGVRGDISYVKGHNNLLAGVNYMQTFLTENDTFGVINPTTNAVCLNADGSPYTSPGLTNPADCVGPLTPNPSFIPALGCYDLTRTAPLPVSDGCSTSTSGLYDFSGHTDIKELAFYAQDNITLRNWSFDLGLRQDLYNGITIGAQTEPRVGIAYNIKPSNTVLRVSYARTYQTPFNENLILSSLGCNYPVIRDLMATTVAPCVSESPLRPGPRNGFNAGLDQAFGRHFALSGQYTWEYTQRAFDFSVLGDSPITFPIEWDKSKISGFTLKGSVPTYHGLSAFVVMSSVAARFWEPQLSGIGSAPVCAPPSGCEVFRIDHDERFNETTHLQYQPWSRGPWLAFNWRFDSGLVSGSAPCYNPNTTTCAGTSTTLDGQPAILIDNTVNGLPLTPDQQFQAGLTCNGVAATPTRGLPSPCLASEFGSTMLSIPSPGTENDDHNPQRVAPRSLFDLAVGDDNIFHTEKHYWSLRLDVINLTDKAALYNWLSTFSGTHYVTPRTVSATLGFHF